MHAIGRCQICDAADAIAMLGCEQGAALPRVCCSCSTAPARSREPGPTPRATSTGAIGLPAVDAIAVDVTQLSSTAIGGTPMSLPAYSLRCNAPPNAAEIGAIMQRAINASAAGLEPPYPVRPPRTRTSHIGLIFVEMPTFRRRRQQGQLDRRSDLSYGRAGALVVVVVVAWCAKLKLLRLLHE